MANKKLAYTEQSISKYKAIIYSVCISAKAGTADKFFIVIDEPVFIEVSK
jgi:hypothetical protein